MKTRQRPRPRQTGGATTRRPARRESPSGEPPSALDFTSYSGVPELENIHDIYYDCPLCGGYRKGKATRKPDREGVPRWFYHCFKCDGLGQGARYFRRLAAAQAVTFARLEYGG